VSVTNNCVSYNFVEIQDMAASSDDVGCVLVMELCHDPQTRQNQSDSSSIIS